MSLKTHPRAMRRMDAEPRNALFMRRFLKFMRWHANREKEEANVVIRVNGYFMYTGGRGLIHKGRKP